MKNKFDKKAVSLMLSYVILVAMVIGLAIAVFIWMKAFANVTPVADCNEGTSLVLENSSCDGNIISLMFRNNGRFNITGVLVSVGNDTNIIPVAYLKDRDLGGIGSNYGDHRFISELGPGDISPNVVFTNNGQVNGVIGTVNFNFVRNIQVQPYIVLNKQKVFCSNAVIKQTIDDCKIR